MRQVEDEKTKKMYNFSHGLTDPGEQKERNYNWPINKDTHVFGKGQFIEKDGAKKSLMPDILVNNYPATKVGDKRLEDFRQATADMLGRSKFKGTLNSNIPNDYTFGVKSLKEGNWNVGKCLNGDPNSISEKMLEPDVDLGKTFLLRSKNEKLHPKGFDTTRSFGVPSVRNDLPEKSRRSVTDLVVS